MKKGEEMNSFKIIGKGVRQPSLALAISLCSAVSFAQVSAPGFEAKPMQVSPISGVEDKEAVFINVTMAPGASSPRHTHPGDCYGAVVEGTVELVVEGSEARRFAGGQAWHNPRGPVHYFKNVGDTPARLVNTLIVDKGKPRTVVEKAPEK
ncbi:MAG TPA: cupin domain-containing protein [Azonexus sp.]|jgi:quercetin dioxygenase-like cupin family protein|nr:cupin domain-containing protein [Azonexus sp.]